MVVNYVVPLDLLIDQFLFIFIRSKLYIQIFGYRFYGFLFFNITVNFFDCGATTKMVERRKDRVDNVHYA